MHHSRSRRARHLVATRNTCHGGIGVSPDNAARFCPLRKGGVDEAHDPPDYLVHKVALDLPI